MASYHLSPPPRLQFIDANGNPYAGGFLKTYAAGSSTPLATYADSSGTANPTTITLDSAGRATVYLGQNAYKFVLYDANNTLVFTQDNITTDFIDSASGQTLQNKTIDDTNVIRVKDSNFRLEAAADSTKTIRFGVGLVSTATERVVLLPDQDITVAGQDYANIFSKGQHWNQGADITAANDLTLGADGNLFNVGGATTINAIKTSGWQAGSIVVLVASSGFTVKHNTAGGAGTSPILLEGQQDFLLGSNDCLMLAYDSAGVWFEISRSVHSSSSTGSFRRVKVTIAHAAILTLPTTPVALVASPGSGYLLQLLQAIVVQNYAAVYTNVNAACYTAIATTVSNTEISNQTGNDIFDGGGFGAGINIACITPKTFEPTALGAWMSAGLNYYVNNSGSGNFTGGDTSNKLDIYLDYIVEKVN